MGCSFLRNLLLWFLSWSVRRGGGERGRLMPAVAVWCVEVGVLPFVVVAAVDGSGEWDRERERRGL